MKNNTNCNKVTVKITQIDNTQAILLPEEFQTTESELLIYKTGNTITLSPKASEWCFLEEN